MGHFKEQVAALECPAAPKQQTSLQARTSANNKNAKKK